MTEDRGQTDRLEAADNQLNRGLRCVSLSVACLLAARLTSIGWCNFKFKLKYPRYLVLLKWYQSWQSIWAKAEMEKCFWSFSKLLSKSHFFCPSTSERFSSKQFVLKIETETQHFGSLTPRQMEWKVNINIDYQHFSIISIKLTLVIYHREHGLGFKNFPDILGSGGNCVTAKLSCMILSFL